jgi:hypothetical protein
MGPVWHTRLNKATCYERMKILEAQSYTQRLHLEEAVRALCDASPLGIADCANLSCTVRLRRWSRIRGWVCAEFSVSLSSSGTKQLRRWRFRNVRTSRNRSEPAENI